MYRGDTKSGRHRRWTKREDEKLRGAVETVGTEDWGAVSLYLVGHGRSAEHCQQRWQRVLREGLVKGAFTESEDETIVQAMHEGGLTWMQIAARIPGRIGKQCRERWTNHLDPNLKKGFWTEEEDMIMVEAQKRWGNAWTKIAELLPGRAENAVKNRWNSAFRRNNSAVFGKPRSEKTLAAVDQARAAMDEIDRQTQMSYRGNHAIAEVVPPQKHRPFLSKVVVEAPSPAAASSSPPRDDERYRRRRRRPEEEEEEKKEDPRILASSSLDSLRAAAAAASATAARDCYGERDDAGLGLLSLAVATEKELDHEEGDLSGYDAYDNHVRRASISASSKPSADALANNDGDDTRSDRIMDEANRKRRRQWTEEEEDGVVVVAPPYFPAQKRPTTSSIGTWPPAPGLITAQTAMERHPEIRNHNQLKELARVKVRRPAMGRASGCDVFVYDERVVAELAASLESPNRTTTWAPPPGKLTMKMAMDKYPQIRHRDQLKHLPRDVIRRPTIGRAAACNVVVYDAADVERLVADLHRAPRASPAPADPASWKPPRGGFLTLQMAMDAYPAIKNRKQLAGVRGVEKVRRPAIGRASGCEITVYPENAVAQVAARLTQEPTPDVVYTNPNDWAPPQGKLTTKMAMDEYPQIRHHDQLRHLQKTKIRRPTMGRFAACSIVVYDEIDIAELAQDLDRRRRAGASTRVEPADDDPLWTPPDGKLTAVEAMKRYPMIRNHNQLRHLPRTKVRRPASGRASGCNMWVYDDRDVRAFARDLEIRTVSVKSSSFDEAYDLVKEDPFKYMDEEELQLDHRRKRDDDGAPSPADDQLRNFKVEDRPTRIFESPFINDDDDDDDHLVRRVEPPPAEDDLMLSCDEDDPSPASRAPFNHNDIPVYQGPED
ncbi:hypothetical protein CTAYLR_006978 [Chrysophaeum taylorii]|uniref:Uncharacterized protein n=1 Tax=Chrysophaeum taylorii TaxID=2483200 RepID=A0AAD7XJW1_9STRA|nr:hypothetical protein CTAYLR_006978 [Chrysophaeum taylorii]